MVGGVTPPTFLLAGNLIIMDELKKLLIQYGYVKDISNLPKQLTGNKRMANFLKLVVEELKSCDSLTGDTKQRYNDRRYIYVHI